MDTWRPTQPDPRERRGETRGPALLAVTVPKALRGPEAVSAPPCFMEGTTDVKKLISEAIQQEVKAPKLESLGMWCSAFSFLDGRCYFTPRNFMCSMKLSPQARGSKQLTPEHSRGEGQPSGPGSSCCWFWHRPLSLLSQPSLPEANQTGYAGRWSGLGYGGGLAPNPGHPRLCPAPAVTTQGNTV